MNFKKHIIDIGNTKIHFRDSGETNKRPMILLHSLSGNGYIFNGLIKLGLGEHFRLIIPDLPG